MLAPREASASASALESPSPSLSEADSQSVGPAGSKELVLMPRIVHPVVSVSVSGLGFDLVCV